MQTQQEEQFKINMEGVTIENLKSQQVIFGGILEVFDNATIPASLAEKAVGSRKFCEHNISVLENTIKTLASNNKKPAKKKAKKVVKKKAAKKLKSVK